MKVYIHVPGDQAITNDDSLQAPRFPAAAELPIMVPIRLEARAKADIPAVLREPIPVRYEALAPDCWLHGGLNE